MGYAHCRKRDEKQSKHTHREVGKAAGPIPPDPDPVVGGTLVHHPW